MRLEKMTDCPMPLDEAAKLAFMRWLSGLSGEPWLPRRRSAEMLWGEVVELVRELSDAWEDSCDSES